MTNFTHSDQIRTLLWSTGGSGEHYHGPASFTYRLYSVAPRDRISITLAHGYPDQEDYSLFARQELIHEFSPNPVDQWRYIRKGCDWIKRHKENFDVFHGITAFHHSVLPAVQAEKQGIPAALFIANNHVELSDKTGFKRLLGLPKKRRKLIQQISAMIAMSRAIYDELIDYGIPEQKIVNIPMGVNTEVFVPAESTEDKRCLREQLSWLEMPTLAFVGGITERKRPHLLIEAVGLLKNRGIDCQLVIVGPEHQPAYVKSMKDTAEHLNVSDRIIWYGFTREPAVLYRASDFFALPSTNEGMSAALVESMSSGLAPIATAISGSEDLIRDGENGRLVDGTAAAIADALAEYIRNPAIADVHARAARQCVLHKYSAHSVYEAYDRLFRRLIAGKVASE